jgi:hypothetical protein
LDPEIRAGMSCFALLDRGELEALLKRLEADLRSGAWERRHEHLLELSELDCRHRLIVAVA